MEFTALAYVLLHYLMSDGFLHLAALVDPAQAKGLVELVTGGLDVATALIGLGTALIGLLTAGLSMAAAVVAIMGTWLALRKQQRDRSTPVLPRAKRSPKSSQREAGKRDGEDSLRGPR